MLSARSSKHEKTASTVDGGDDGDSDSISTPPTDDGETDGFFALDVDLDVSKMCLADQANSCTASVTADDKVPSWSPTSAQLAPEPDVRGNLEYKLRILPQTRHRYDRLLTQLKWRILQGGGRCTYEIGVLDDGACIGVCSLEMLASLRVLLSMSDELGASVRVCKAFRVDEVGAGEPISLHTSSLCGRDVQGLLDAAAAHPRAVCVCGVSAAYMGETLSYLPDNGQVEMRLGLDAGMVADHGVAGNILIDVDGECVLKESSGGRSGTEEWPVAVDSTFDNVATDFADDDQGSDAPAGFFNFDEDGAPEGDEDVEGNTFSLSLDEQATRLGIGFQRKASEHRRKCRYDAKSAQHRQRAALEEARACGGPVSPLHAHQDATPPPKQTDESELAKQPPSTRPARLHHSVSSTHVETGALHAPVTDEDGVAPRRHGGCGGSDARPGAPEPAADGVRLDQAGADTGTAAAPCTRLILEVDMSRVLGRDAYIDYASL